MIKWLHERCRYYCYKEINCAAKYGYIEVVKWLFYNRHYKMIENDERYIIINPENHQEYKRAIIFAAEFRRYWIL